MSKINPSYKPEDLIDDIRASATASALSEKYGLKAVELEEALKRFYLKGLITESELRDGIGKPFSEEELADLAGDVKRGLFYEEIREKYDLSEADLNEAFEVMASRGLASERDMSSTVRAVSPREVVKDLIANQSEEALKGKYGLSSDEFRDLLIALADRSFISSDEFRRYAGPEPSTVEPPLIKVYEAKDEFQMGLVETLMDEAGIEFFPREKRAGPARSILGKHFPLEIFVEETDAQEARARLYELQQMEEPFVGEIHYEERQIPVFESLEDQLVADEDLRNGAPDDEPRGGPNNLIRLLGVVALIALLAYIFGVIKFY